MDFEKILNLGVEKNIINETQRNGLIDLYYQNNNEPKQVSTVVKVFYYIGGFIMLGAMTALMSDTIQHSTSVFLASCLSINKIDVFTPEYGLNTPLGKLTTAYKNFSSTSFFLNSLYALAL